MINKKFKTLLPFALYEELENLDQLDPIEMKNFLLSLRRYCDSTGKDYGKICKDLEIEEPGWSGKLTPRQIRALDKAVESRYSSEKGSWSLNPETGLVDTEGRFVASSSPDFKEGSLLGIKFGKANGDFLVNGCGLTTLEGCPEEVTGTFNAASNKMENLVGGPKKARIYNVSSCPNLNSLKGSPEIVDTSFSVSDCRSLGSLEGGPKKSGSYTCDTTSIKNLKGAPEEISGEYSSFSAKYCYSLSSLEGAPILNRPSSFRNPSYSFEDCPNLYSLEGLPLDKEYNVHLEKNGLKPNVLRKALSVAKETKSWIVAYLSMFTDPDFIKTGKAPKDPIREKLAPANIKKEIEQNGERFVVGLKSIWNDFRVKKILREIEIPEDTKADAEMLSALDDIGL